jgi:hypothetical protein
MCVSPCIYWVFGTKDVFDSHHLLYATSGAKGIKKRTDASLLARGSLFFARKYGILLKYMVQGCDMIL